MNMNMNTNERIQQHLSVCPTTDDKTGCVHFTKDGTPRRTVTGLHIAGRRWFDRSAGNTYHTVQIFGNGETLASLPMEYGYGDCYLQTALDWLKANGYVPQDAQYGTEYLRETLKGTYSVTDVTRKKDL